MPAGCWGFSPGPPQSMQFVFGAATDQTPFPSQLVDRAMRAFFDTGLPSPGIRVPFSTRQVLLPREMRRPIDHPKSRRLRGLRAGQALEQRPQEFHSSVLSCELGRHPRSILGVLGVDLVASHPHRSCLTPPAKSVLARAALSPINGATRGETNTVCGTFWIISRDMGTTIARCSPYGYFR